MKWLPRLVAACSWMPSDEMPAPKAIRESGASELTLVLWAEAVWPAPPSGLASATTRLEDEESDWAMSTEGAASNARESKNAVCFT